MAAIDKPWYTLKEVAAMLHVSVRHARRLVEPHKARCHLARNGKAPRLVLWVSDVVVRELISGRDWYLPK